MVETLMLRTPGLLFQKLDETHISNLYTYEIINKTTKPLPIEFRLVSPAGHIRMVGNTPTTKPGTVTKGELFIDLDKKNLAGEGNSTRLKIEVISDGKVIDRVKTNFLGPIQ